MGFFLPALDGGGAERSLLTVASWLAEQGIAVDFLLARARGPLLPLVPSRVRIVDLGARKTVASLPGLLDYLRREQPEVIVASLNAAVVALAAKRFFLPRQRVVAHYSSTFSGELRVGRLQTRIMMRPLRRLLPAADLVIVNSAGAGRDLARAAPKVASKVHVVWPAVNAEGAVDDPPAHPWFQAPGPPIVVSAGRLVTAKNFATVIRAFGEVRRRTPARLLLLGEGPERRVLEALVRDLGLVGAVDLPGFVADPLPYVARAQVFAFASPVEGMGRVIPEALACGTPVVSTDCPHGPSEALGAGRWGRLVPVGDWSAMADAILATLEDPPDPSFLQRRGRAFSPEAMGRRWTALLFRHLREKTPGAV